MNQKGMSDGEQKLLVVCHANTARSVMAQVRWAA